MGCIIALWNVAGRAFRPTDYRGLGKTISEKLLTIQCITTNSIPGISSFLGQYRRRIIESPNGSRLARGAFWSLAGALISRSLGLLSSIIVARIMGKVGFGELGIIQSTFGMVAVFAGFGMGLTATKYVAELRATNPVRAGRIIGICSLISWGSGLIMAMVLAMLSSWLAVHVLDAPHLARFLRIGSLLLLMGTVNGAQTGAISGFEAFRAIARINLFSGVIAFPAMVCGTWLLGLEGAVWGLVVSQAANLLFNYIALRKEAHRANVPLGYAGCFQERGIVWRFSLPAMISGVMVGPVNWLCSILIVNQPNGYAEMGLFNAASQWRQTILFLPYLLASVALPMLSNLRGPTNTQSYRRIFWANVALAFFVASAIALPVGLFSSWIMTRYGASFLSGSRVLEILCAVSVIVAVANVVGLSIISEGRLWFGFILNCVWAIAMILLSYLLRENGALGLSIAYLAAYSLHLMTVSLYVYYRKSRLWGLPDTKVEFCG